MLLQNANSGDIQPSTPFVSNTWKLHAACIILIYSSEVVLDI